MIKNDFKMLELLCNLYISKNGKGENINQKKYLRNMYYIMLCDVSIFELQDPIFPHENLIFPFEIELS